MQLPLEGEEAFLQGYVCYYGFHINKWPADILTAAAKKGLRFTQGRWEKHYFKAHIVMQNVSGVESTQLSTQATRRLRTVTQSEQTQ